MNEVSIHFACFDKIQYFVEQCCECVDDQQWTPVCDSLACCKGARGEYTRRPTAS